MSFDGFPIFIYIGIVLCMAMNCGASTLPASDAHTSTGAFVNGEFLMHLGQLYNKPLLKMLGKSLDNLEKQVVCHYHPCSAWSEWSPCRGSHARTFNMTSRVRQCGVNTTRCTYPLASHKNETEYQLCEVNCPDDYTVTRRGFCLKYHNTAMNNSAADATCWNEAGGHLVNIDSKEKSDDVAAYRKEIRRRDGVTISRGIWIDGYRTSVSSAWKVRHGDRPASFSNWAPREPGNMSFELCRMVVQDYYKWNWYSTHCGNGYNFICEVKQV